MIDTFNSSGVKPVKIHKSKITEIASSLLGVGSDSKQFQVRSGLAVKCVTVCLYIHICTFFQSSLICRIMDEDPETKLTFHKLKNF